MDSTNPKLRQVIDHLSQGQPVSLELPPGASFALAQRIADKLERQVGLPLARRQLITAQGCQVVVWVVGLCADPFTGTLLGERNGPLDAD